MERPDPSTVALLMEKEVREASRSRWFITFSGAFIALTLGLAWMGLAGIGSMGPGSFSRTSASMLNLVLLMVPLMGLVMGAMSMSGERESGFLLYLLSQPVTASDALLGKYLGLSLSLMATLMIGYGISGVVMATVGGAAYIQAYLALVALSLLLTMVCLGLGLWVAVLARRPSTAIGVALVLWLALVFLADLGVMGTAIVLRMKLPTLVTIALLNPLQVFKLAAVLQIHGGLEVLGPAGIFAVRNYGTALLPLLIGILLIWIIVPVVSSIIILSRRGAI